MRKVLGFFLICIFTLMADPSYAEPPPYAKWGRLAMQEAAKRYPQAEIIDYLHLGRDSLGSNVARETFRLWLRQNRREWGILVSITFHTRTEQVLSVKITDLSQRVLVNLWWDNPPETPLFY